MSDEVQVDAVEEVAEVADPAEATTCDGCA